MYYFGAQPYRNYEVSSHEIKYSNRSSLCHHKQRGPLSYHQLFLLVYKYEGILNSPELLHGIYVLSS